MSTREAGRIGAAVILAGLGASIFLGERALLWAFLVAASLGLVWNVALLKIEISRAIKKKAWGRVLVIAVAYSLPLAILGWFIWFVGGGPRCDPRQANAKGEAALERGDIEAAVEAVRSCAEAGMAEYQFTLAFLMNDDVEDPSKPQRDAEVLKWLRAAASQGHTEAASQLAYFHRWGHVGLPKDEEMALCWERVAEGEEAASECFGQAVPGAEAEGQGR